MGREVRRVPLDFKWPLKMLWKGFMSPYHAQKCDVCDGQGLNPATKKIADEFYAFGNREARWCEKITQDEVDALIKAGRLWDFTRTWTKDEGWVTRDPPVTPTAEQVNTWQAGRGMGHDGINRWILIEARARRLGVWGKCWICNGEGDHYCHERYRRLADKWEPIKPPEGTAYQLWETVSEGSPISLPFETPEELARWLAENGVGGLSGETITYNQWMKFIRGPGWAPSMIGVGGNLKSGVIGMIEEKDKEEA